MNHVVDLVAALIWPLAALGAVWYFREPIRTQLLPRLTGVAVLGLQFSFAENALARASKDKPKVTEKTRGAALARLHRERELLAGARILWVDNAPRNNFNERRVFERFGARIDAAVSTDEALHLARMHPYDLVISDWSRPGSKSAGPELVTALRRERLAVPVVFYVSSTEGRDAGDAFAMTNRPDSLIHYVLDALESEREWSRR